ncbi:MAG: hypothetical protein SVU88_01615, partial [Candidatus Nanohaloarchaea archaeon]|nr:hypothetical protein [Candidatus Nanohaloarchaea archaeon]
PSGVTRTAEWGRMWNPVVYAVGTAVEAARYMDGMDPAAVTEQQYGRAMDSFEDVVSYAHDNGVDALAAHAAGTVHPVLQTWSIDEAAYADAVDAAYGDGASGVVDDGREFLESVSRGQGSPQVESDRIAALEAELQAAIDEIREADGRPPQDAIEDKNAAQSELDYEQRRELFHQLGVDVQDGFDTTDVKARIERNLRQERNLEEGEEDFTVSTPEDII